MKAKPRVMQEDAIAFLFISSKETHGGFSISKTRSGIERTEYQHSRSVGILVDRSTRDIVIYSIKKE